MRRVRFASDARLAWGLLLLSALALGAFVVVGFGPLPSRALRATESVPPAAPITAPTEFVDVTEEVGLAGWRHDVEHGVLSIADAVAPGIGLLDLDQDRDLDLVLLRGSAAPVGIGILLNQLVPEGKLRFVDATAECGISWRGAAQGVCAGDVDQDGDVDLFISALGRNLLLRNLLLDQGELGFADATEEAGVGGTRWHWVRIDARRLPLARPGPPTDALGATWLDHEVPEFSTGVSFGDLDADGDLDLYVANYLAYFAERHALTAADETTREDRPEPPEFKPTTFEPQQDRLYLNEGGEEQLLFSDVTRIARLDDHGGRGMGAVFLRIDGDDYPDLYVANDATDNICLHNIAADTPSMPTLRRRLEHATDGFGLDDRLSGMGIARGDADGDADLDVLTTNWRRQSASLFLFRIDERPQADGTLRPSPFFERLTEQSGLAEATSRFVGWGCVFLDFDNDGDQDLFIGNGYTSPRQPQAACQAEYPLLFLNTGGGRFVDVTSSAGAALARSYAARGVVTGDIDGDGDLDLLLAQNHGPVVCLENRLARGAQSLVVEVRIGALRRSIDAAPDARQEIRGDAVNVQLFLDSGGRKQVVELLSGGSYLSQGPFEAHFGLGSAARADEVRIVWPSPRVRKVTLERNPKAGRLLVETAPER
ncbi:MAG: hypothetical protein FJ293_03750 [Planctomycetes bacterium]|nr:hypothetical protein [Planctomycetota bacterium]